MQYIATTDILIRGVIRAHVEGDTVPAENVEANGWEDLVRVHVDESPAAETEPASEAPAETDPPVEDVPAE